MLGISSFSYTWSVGVPGNISQKPLNIFGLLDKTQKCGVKLVQICDNLPLHTLPYEILQEFKDRSSKLGITIEVGTRGLKPAILEKYLSLTVLLKSRILRIVIDLLDYEPTEDEIVEILKEFMPEFKKYGVTLAIENHDRFPVKVLANIIQKVGSEYLGICLDTVNSFGASEGTETVVDILGPLTVNLHVKDYVIERAHHNMGFAVSGAPAGRGALNVPWLLGKLKSFNRQPNAILELWTPPEKNITDTIIKEDAWVKESIEYLRTLIIH